MSFAPESVLHQVHPFDQGIALELGRKQIVQLRECLLKFGMVIARLSKLGVAPFRDASDFHQRNSLAQECRKGNLLRLERIVRQLNSKCDAKSLALGRVHRQGPYRIKIEPSGTRLHVAPIAADVENIDERQARDLLHVLLERFPARPRRERRAALFPCVADESKARITERAFGWCCKQHCLPALILVDFKRTLIQSVRSWPDQS